MAFSEDKPEIGLSLFNLFYYLNYSNSDDFLQYLIVN